MVIKDGKNETEAISRHSEALLSRKNPAEKGRLAASPY